MDENEPKHSNFIDLSKLPLTTSLIKPGVTPLPLPDKFNGMLDIRSETVKMILEQLEATMNGALNLDMVKNAKSILDLGMGRGSVGGALKEISSGNQTFHLAGVDMAEYPDNLYQLYNTRIKGNITNKAVWDEMTKLIKPADLIISVGLPGEVLGGILQSDVIEKILAPNGNAIHISEQGFNISNILSKYDYYKGPVNNNVFIHKKSSSS